MLRRIAAAWFGGAVGALANSIAVWLVSRAGLLAAIGVAIAPALTWHWLAPRLVWGSLWALPFPFLVRSSPSAVRAGLLLSLAPSTAQLLYFFPHTGHGLLGLSLGAATPLVVLAANAVWGVALAWTAVAAGGR